MASRVERRGPITLEHYSTIPLYNTKAVARQTGVPAPTLRAWERRYGILSPRRGPNDYRLYSERDIATVRWLREEIESGLTISQAIALLRSLNLVYSGSEKRVVDRSPATEATNTLQEMVAESTIGQQSPHAALAQGATNQTSQLETLAADLLEACIRLDEASAQYVLASIFALFSVEQAITDVLEPMLEEMGERWQAGQFSITVEHFATALIRSRLGAIFHAQATPASGPLVLVGCAPGEQHELGALVLALLLRRHYPALRVIYLGQNVEATHLLETIQTSHPAVVCLSAALLEHRPSLAAVARQIATLPPVHRPKLVYGGRAFDQKDEEVDGIFLGTNAAQALILIEHLCTYPTFFRS